MWQVYTWPIIKHKKLHNAFAEEHVLVGFKCPILHLNCCELIIRTIPTNYIYTS